MTQNEFHNYQRQVFFRFNSRLKKDLLSKITEALNLYRRASLVKWISTKTANDLWLFWKSPILSHFLCAVHSPDYKVFDHLGRSLIDYFRNSEICGKGEIKTIETVITKSFWKLMKWQIPIKISNKLLWMTINQTIRQTIKRTSTLTGADNFFLQSDEKLK